MSQESLKGMRPSTGQAFVNSLGFLPGSQVTSASADAKAELQWDHNVFDILHKGTINRPVTVRFAINRDYGVNLKGQPIAGTDRDTYLTLEFGKTASDRSFLSSKDNLVSKMNQVLNTRSTRSTLARTWPTSSTRRRWSSRRRGSLTR